MQDVVSIAGLPAVPLDFYLITKQTSGFWDDPFDGVFGMHALCALGSDYMLITSIRYGLYRERVFLPGSCAEWVAA